MESQISVSTVGHFKFQQSLCRSLLLIVLLCGCSSVPSDPARPRQRETFVLSKITPQEGVAVLSALGLGTKASTSEPNTLVVSGSVADVETAGIVLELVDTGEAFVVQTLAPASMVRALPSNSQIAGALGDIAIGTFAHPPQSRRTARAIIDVCGESVVAIAPARLWPDIRAVVELGPQAKRDRTTVTQEGLPSGSGSERKMVQDESIAPGHEQADSTADVKPSTPASAQEVVQASEFDLSSTESATSRRVRRAATVGDTRASAQKPEVAERKTASSAPGTTTPAAQNPEVSRGVLRPSAKIDRSVSAVAPQPALSFPNGDDVLELSLPEKIELIQLLDLAGTYLNLDCIYEAEKIGNQVITLKLHSKLRSEMRVKDLYSLLETVLKFKGLVMTRCEGNLVTIVPATDALEIDPQFVDPNNRAIQAGDMVVTRVFELQHVDVSSVTSLLQNMKLSVAVSPIPETQTLFVTCYARRMARIEQLVDMVDRPGRPREFRFRQLKYAMAATLARKVLALAQELEGIAISIGSAQAEPSTAASRSSRPAQAPGEARGTQVVNSPTVYLDTDERTNRMLMIGLSEQLDTVEGLIDTLDVPQQDLRTIQVYDIEHVDASIMLDKLLQLGIISQAGRTAARAPRPTGPAGPTESAPTEETQVVLLEATNSLLVNATQQQHQQIQRVIEYIDVAPQDLRTLKLYTIKHMDAEDVARKLQQLQAVDQVAAPAARPARISQAGPAQATPAAIVSSPEAAASGSGQVVVLEVSNSLLVNATAEQHERIRQIVEHIDTEAPKETVPYEVYFLENQDPEQLAGVLTKLIQETVTNADGKVQQVIHKTDEPISIIPDKGTFSLIVHANRKDQDWLAAMVQKLDKRRPQVLIDVTLVEITQTEAFNYDLNLIQSIPNLTATSGLTGTLVPGSPPVTSADIVAGLDASGRERFIDLQSNSGDFTGFYGDRHINALLRAMQSKNYGRILAKPKILVNDNEPGTIKTADTTYVAKRSSVPVTTGAAGTNTTLIETAVDFQSYEAGITLNITPHISQGDILRMGIELTRSDFRETEDTEKPPDTTLSELKTTVFVPDGSTIILGGLLRLNQNKGGAKVPILGDIPLVGGLFRSINKRDTQSKLYIFVKAEIIRPAGAGTQRMADLEEISETNRQAFEKHEREFQGYEDWPGIKPKPVEPRRVLEAR